MNIVKCENAHFYDSDRYKRCPHCLSNEELYMIPKKYRELGKISRLDRGSTCRVYKIDSDRPLVLKVNDLGKDETKYYNALYEEHIIEAVRFCPRVVDVLEYEIIESKNESKTVFVLEDYYESLDNYVATGACEIKNALKIAIDICEVVIEIIDREVLHLDLKPKNIFLDGDKKIRLGDFGSAVMLNDLPKNHSMRGTPEYMAPEVYQEHKCSEQSEIYSIGLIVYYLLNNRKLPFADDVFVKEQKELAVYKRLAGTELPLLSLHVPLNIEKEINSLISNACAFKTNDRIKRVVDFKARLTNILQTIEESTEFASMNDPIQKKVLPIIFMIDTSGSMSGSQSVNQPVASSIDPFDEESWNADSIAASCILQHSMSDITTDLGDTASSNQLSVFGGDSDWDDDPWSVDPMATSVAITGRGNNDAIERRRKLAEALLNGQPVKTDSEGNTQINVFDNPKSSEGDSVLEEINGVDVPEGKLAGGMPNRCRVCDNMVFPGAQFCPYCGSKVIIEKPAVQLSQVEFSAIAPKHLVKGEYSIIDIVMYEEEYRHIVDEIHRQADTETQEKKSGKMNIPVEANIKVILDSPDIEIEDNEMFGIWESSYLDFSFPVYLPDDYKKKQVLFSGRVFVNDIIATKLSFVVRCSSLFEQKLTVKREDVLSAFISYASQDRRRVATIVQGMQRARPDMDLFFDVESLRTGDDWEKTLYKEIENRDILYLCWSHFAKDSEWVDREWRHAFAQKGVDGIEPLPIELPEECPPPQELSGKHWNDKLLYLIDHSNGNVNEKIHPGTEWDWDDGGWE